MSIFSPKMASEDYGSSMMPHNRREVYKDVFKLHYRELLLCGLIAFAFMLPLHLTALWEILVKSSISGGLSADAGADEVLEATYSIISFSNTRGLIDIPLWMLFFLGLSGIARVIRQYAWEENVYFRYEFLVGIKDNWKQYVLMGFLVGVLKFVCTYISNMSVLASEQGEIYSYLGLIPSVLFAVFLIPPAMYAAVNITVYKNPFRRNLRIGFALYAKNVWKTILAVALCAIAFIPQMIPNLICVIVGRILSSLLLPFIMLAWWLFTYNGLDELINPKYAPSLIGRGTVPLTEKDKEEIARRKQLEEEKDNRKKLKRLQRKSKNNRK